METHWHLYEKDFFWDLPVEKEKFLSLSTKRSLKKNEFVFFEEDPGESCFYLEKGTVKIFRVTALGKEPIFFVRKAGEMFGLAEVIDAKERKCNAQALTPSVLYEINKENFEFLLSRYHSLSRKVIKVLDRRLRYLGEQIENLMVCDVATRMLKLLFYLCCNSLIDRASLTLNKPIKVPINLTQEQMASLTGSCQQTVSETLKELQQSGLIQISKKEITLLNPLQIIDKISQ
ncbi:MAG: Crp/Fnr family transcriptional regulator [Desulfobacterales bacterium]|nr:Crp/Fnr family transcriptional regulator [Desulfobacterales bacterium]